MNISEAQFRALLGELIDDNPFACRALLQILDTQFTAAVPTLAVSCEGQPRLLVNLDFVREHCNTEAHVKAVVCHEFLHVLLRHTERTVPVSPAQHLALDAVINAIIHRSMGESYSSFMQHYYAAETGIHRLLRPWRDRERQPSGGRLDPLWRVWTGLYAGNLVADDIRELAQDLAGKQAVQPPPRGWLGNHDDAGESEERAPAAAELSPVVQQALDRALRSMNGSGIWRAPHGRGVAAQAWRSEVSAAEEQLQRWRSEAWRVLRKHLLPDPHAAKTEQQAAEYRLPVLSPGDRRSFARALWNPLIPDAAWEGRRRSSSGTAQVYLDVSGSMSAEMPLIVALLAHLGNHIRRPFWAFSDVVVPAVISHNRLQADTTGGTSIACVLTHLAATRPRCAVIVTDGYIEAIDKRGLKGVAGIRLHAILTRDGSSHELGRAGIPFTQLGRLPS